jgi:hypothetical protein
MADLVAGGRVDRCGAVPRREVGVGREAGDVADLDEQTSSTGRADSVQVGQGGRSRLHCGSARGPAAILECVLCICRSVFGTMDDMASYSVNPDAVANARRLIDARQYVLDSDWGTAQPGADEQNTFLKSHNWQQYAEWHLGLTDGARQETKARYAFVFGDFRRVHRTALIASVYRASEWRHKEVELAAHDLLQQLDAASG